MDSGGRGIAPTTFFLFGRDVLLGIEHAGHDFLNRVGDRGNAFGHSSVDGACSRVLVLMLHRIGDSLGQVASELFGDAGLCLGASDAHMQRIGVLLAIEPPAAIPHEVVQQVDVEYLGEKREAEAGLSDDFQLWMRSHKILLCVRLAPASAGSPWTAELLLTWLETK